MAPDKGAGTHQGDGGIFHAAPSFAQSLLCHRIAADEGVIAKAQEACCYGLRLSVGQTQECPAWTDHDTGTAQLRSMRYPGVEHIAAKACSRGSDLMLFDQHGPP
jgi:hypothetical protein